MTADLRAEVVRRREWSNATAGVWHPVNQAAAGGAAAGRAPPALAEGDPETLFPSVVAARSPIRYVCFARLGFAPPQR